jgi:uncharacterized protein (TIGR03492 family)
MPRLLILSDGHGEDAIAGKVVDRLFALGLGRDAVEAWPIVGEGRAFQQRAIRCVGVPNLLPSAGFATLSARWMWRDLRAGWIRVHLAQARAAARLRGRYAVAVAVGDVIPMALAALARAPFVFVGCAKSVFYARRRYRYNAVELALLRRRALVTYPRDEATPAWLVDRGVSARFAGNPMMDDLERSGAPLDVPEGQLVIAALPGSRRDAGANTVALFQVAEHLAELLPDPAATHLLVAAASGECLEQLLAYWTAHGQPEWRRADGETDGGSVSSGCILKLVHRSGLGFQVLVGRFADVLHRATLAIGLAGTANEQAIGLGRPVITFPTGGAFDNAYLRMKMPLLGEAAIRVAPDPRTVALAARDLVADPGRLARMAEAGRLRMGQPGASAVIAADLMTRLAPVLV